MNVIAKERDARRSVSTLAAAVAAALLIAGCSNVPLQQPTIVDRSTGSTTDTTVVSSSVEDSGRTHTVVAGDTFYNISQRNGCTPSALMSLNGVSDPTTLRIGQVLRLPTSTTTPVTTMPAGVRVERMDTTATARTTSNTYSTASSTSSTSAPIVEAVVSTIRVDDETSSSAERVKAAVTSAQASAEETRTSVQTAAENASAQVSAKVEEAKTKATAAVESAQAAIPGSRLIWPARGEVLSTYAQNGKGLDIGGAVGSIIVAAGAGEVLFVGDSVAGYGNLVIVKHSPTLVTAYGHNSKIVVKPGDRVKSGQKIAEMGKDDQGRASLRFEVRDKGRPVDPMKHLTPRNN